MPQHLEITPQQRGEECRKLRVSIGWCSCRVAALSGRAPLFLSEPPDSCQSFSCCQLQAISRAEQHVIWATCIVTVMFYQGRF